MNDVRVRLSNVFIISAIVGAGAFAAGRSTGGSTTASSTIAHDPVQPAERPALPLDAPGMGGGTANLPPGHPAVDPNAPPSPPMGQGATDTPARSLEWKVPPRWQTMPNTSSMRIATYRVPRSTGDSADADVSVTQAGGTISANVDRWIGQFGPEGQKNAKQTTKKIAGLDVTIVEVEGSFNGGMGMGAKPDPSAKTEGSTALLGAIVATPGMPHFFKITGPTKTVQSARAELDALLASLSTKS